MDFTEYKNYITQNVLDSIYRLLDINNQSEQTNSINSSQRSKRKPGLLSFDDVFGQYNRFNDDINFYPSDNKDADCKRIAFFVSLKGKRWNLKPSARLDFSEMFKKLIQHCQGNCSQTTKTAIIITDNWDDDEVESWKSNLQKIESNGIEIELKIITPFSIISKPLVGNKF